MGIGIFMHHCMHEPQTQMKLFWMSVGPVGRSSGHDAQLSAIQSDSACASVPLQANLSHSGSSTQGDKKMTSSLVESLGNNSVPIYIAAMNRNHSL